MINTVVGAAGLLAGQNTLTSSPLWKYIQDLANSWLKVDVGVIVAVCTLAGMVPVVSPWVLKVYWWILRFFTASVSISPNDRLNREVIDWVGVNVLQRQARRILTARSELVDADTSSYFPWNTKNITRNDVGVDKTPVISYTPTFGTTWFYFERSIFIVRRIDKQEPRSERLVGISDASNEWSSTPEGREPLLVLRLGRSVAPIQRFLAGCHEYAVRQREAHVTVRACNHDRWGEARWDATLVRPRRALETVHLDAKVKDGLVADIQNYLRPETRRFYHRRGIPYRRGYLLHGPAGTGKTSLAFALASHFELELYILDLPGISTDAELRSLFMHLPPQCFVLLEDIDAVGIRKRPSRKKGDNDDESDGEDNEKGGEKVTMNKSNITLSGLLNVIDGVAAQEGRIVLMTSNFADRLDTALVRPGRIDRKVFMGNISRQSAEDMFLRWFARDSEWDSAAKANEAGCLDDEEKGNAKMQEPHEKEEIQHVCDNDLRELAARFSAQIPEDKFTPALLQSYLQMTPYDPRQAVEEVAGWVQGELVKVQEEEDAKRAEKERRKKAKMRTMLEAAEVTAMSTLKVAETLARQDSGPTGGGKVPEAMDENASMVNGCDGTAADRTGVKTPTTPSSGVTSNTEVSV